MAHSFQGTRPFWIGDVGTSSLPIYVDVFDLYFSEIHLSFVAKKLSEKQLEMILPDTWWLLPIGTAVLAIAAFAGYWLGRHRLRPGRRSRRRVRPEVERALSIIGDLENVASQLRHALSHHGSALRKFATRLVRFEREQVVARHELCDQAEEMLKPAMRLTAEISDAYARLAQQMSHLATFAELRADPITGAANRVVLDETLDAILSDAASSTAGPTVAMVEIDFFEQINDSRSLLQGDRVLIDLGAALRQSIRPSDLLARFGNEDFAIVMPDTDITVAAARAETIRTAIRDHMPVTVSIGLAAAQHNDTAAAVLGRASAALAKAKAAGRDCVYQFDEADSTTGETQSQTPTSQSSVPTETNSDPAANPAAESRTESTADPRESWRYGAPSAPEREEEPSAVADDAPLIASPN